MPSRLDTVVGSSEHRAALSVERQPELAHRLPPEERVQLLRDLDAQIAELTTLAGELVELAREEAMRTTPEPVGLVDAVEAAAARVRTRAPGLTFDTELDQVTVDGPAVGAGTHGAERARQRRQVEPGRRGVVQVRLRVDGDDAVLTVTDTGPGVDAEDLPHVFDRFYPGGGGAGHPRLGAGPGHRRADRRTAWGTVTAGPNEPCGTTVTIRLPQAGVTDR